ncbi:uncharacterized protein LOC132197001 isoform X2 [Neocloeon triangulifer]|uniref:uncharacterized protein LOC132197001 isoform X2 n=1 Tax=Neocloeon triangulifer TaxID=2078957 RepID=UPI00286F4B67|nr:uncharacterized protein LOC132197001 isoform X2 [Neocloeon triangulifer]
MTRETANPPVAAPRTKKVRNPAPLPPPPPPPCLHTPVEFTEESPPPPYAKREKKGKKAPKPPVPEKPCLKIEIIGSCSPTETQSLSDEILTVAVLTEVEDNLVETAAEEKCFVLLETSEPTEVNLTDENDEGGLPNYDFKSLDSVERSENHENFGQEVNDMQLENDQGAVFFETDAYVENIVVTENEEFSKAPKIIDEILKPVEEILVLDENFDLRPPSFIPLTEEEENEPVSGLTLINAGLPPVSGLPPIPATPVESKSIFKFYTPSQFNPRVNSTGAFKVKPIDFGLPKPIEQVAESALGDNKQKIMEPVIDEKLENQTLEETKTSTKDQLLLSFDSIDEPEETLEIDDQAGSEENLQKLPETKAPAEINNPLKILIDEVEDDIFGIARKDGGTFSVAAISPRENQGTETIHQNFNNFTKHMLANDYILIEAGKQPINAEEKSNSKAGGASNWVIEKCETILEERAFDVDWGQFSANGEKESPNKDFNEQLWPVDYDALYDNQPNEPHSAPEVELLSEKIESNVERNDEAEENNPPKEEEECEPVQITNALIPDVTEEIFAESEEAAENNDEEKSATEEPQNPNEREVRLEKSWGILGLRLEVTCLEEDEEFAVVIAEVMPGGAAEHEGTLKPGDRILAVNGSAAGSLEETVRLFRIGPDVVQLRILPDAAATVEMGSNVSCEKGLHRRSVSSGHIDAPLPRTSKVAHLANHNGSQTLNKHCASLPDYLDRENDPENNNRVNSQLNMELKLHSLLPRDNGAPERLPPLLLPPPPLFHDAVNDQGYGSERSPEEEKIPLLLPKYPFITQENVFEVNLSKGSRGLGLSVTGGVDCANEPWPGLIRIKRLFPRQPAWQDGNLAPGDVLLEANGIHLTGMTNYEALEVLRTTSVDVTLKVCRPPAGAGLLSVDLDESEIKPLGSNLRLNIPPPEHSDESNDEGDGNHSKDKGPVSGEFTITINKIEKSLGFTLWKEDTSRLGHYVRALVKEPAVSDGRIRPGDKIMAVNDVEFSELSHEEAVAFLRKCGEVVTIKLYRDAAQTPLSILSPTEGFRTFPRTRPILRKEAMDMLNDLAGKKHGSPHDSDRNRRASDGQPHKHFPPKSSSPRRKKLQTPPSQGEKMVEKTAALDVTDASGRAALQLSLQALADAKNEENQSRSSSRPVSLDLSTPSSVRKQKFQFISPSFSGEEDEDDSSIIAGLSPPNEYPGPSSLVSQPASMPPMNLEASSYRKPLYQSANFSATQSPSLSASSDQEISQKQQNPHGLLKWKGVMLNPLSKASTPATPVQKPPPTNLDNVDGEVLVVELSRGWNSRLGFTLTEAEGGKTVIKQIYPDSVAYKDGRLKAGDHVVMVNDENMEVLPTAEVIDLVRKIRGSVAITVVRPRKEE